MPTGAFDYVLMSHQFSEELAEALGWRPSLAAMSFIGSEGFLERYIEAGATERRRDVVTSAVPVLVRLRDAGLERESLEDNQNWQPNGDKRWLLLLELSTAMRDEVGCGSMTGAPVVVGAYEVTDELPGPSVRLFIDVDSRVPTRSAVFELQLLMSGARDRYFGGRRSRELGAESLNLVRFVCLETKPEHTWRDRLELWNTGHPAAAEQYPDARALISDFRRAEQNLTGQRGGLRWFYDENEHGRPPAPFSVIAPWLNRQDEQGETDEGSHRKQG